MLVRTLEPDDMEYDAQVHMQYLYPWPEVVATPFGSAWALLEPGEASKSQMHHEAETFFVMRGSATLVQDGERRRVQTGDVVYLPPFSTHVLENDSGERFLFATVWWQDMALAAAHLAPAAESGAARRPVVVMAAPPTPNGDLHLGHLSGPYLGADIHTRYLRLRGIKTWFVTGSDEFQTSVLLKAETRGESPHETASHFSDEIVWTLAAMEIRPDSFTRPGRDAGYVEFIQQFFTRLYERGAIIAKETQVLFCPRCDEHLFELSVAGICPHCGEPCAGNSCEECGRPNQGVDMRDPIHTRCGTAAEHRPLTLMYIPIDKHRELIRARAETVPASTHMRALSEVMSAAALPDLPITHVSTWGIPVPIEGFDKQRISAWFEMLPGYLFGMKAAGVAGIPDGAADPSANEAGAPIEAENILNVARTVEVVQFFGFDNAYYHSLLHTSSLVAGGMEAALPASYVCNEFYRLDGRKFSTSRNHAVWGRELLKSADADCVRLYLSFTRPEVDQSNFTQAEFERFVEDELHSRWMRWLRKLQGRVDQSFDGVAPESGFWTSSHRTFFSALRQTAQDVGSAFEASTFSPRRATRRLCELVRLASDFGAAEEHWRGIASRHDELRTAVALELAAARQLAILSSPIMPGFAARLWRDLGCAGTVENAGWEEVPLWVPAGSNVHIGSYFGYRQTGGIGNGEAAKASHQV